MTKQLAVSSLLAFVLLAGGCTVGKDYTPPKVETPGAFAQLDGTMPIGSSSDLPDEVKLASWWETMNDPVLSGLVQRALASNLDLRVAAERVREARALRGIAESSKFPTVDVNGTAQRQRGSENLGGNIGNDRDSSFFDAGLDASWEIDVFGGIRRSVEASRADLQGTIEQERSVRVTLAAEVARNYVELRSLQERQRVLDRSIGAQRDTVKLTQERLDAGIAPKLDVAQSQAQLATRLSQLPPVLAGQRSAVHRLSVLLGAQPGALAAELMETQGAIPKLGSMVASGLPSDLLRRRPDVRAAERRIAAATARVGVAEADLFPKFSLTGSFGLQSDTFGKMADLDSRAWGIGPAMRWNLFDGERLRRTVDAAASREQQSILEYQQVVLLAIEEAENALVDLKFAQQRNAALQEAVRANQEAVDLADALYRGQLSTFLNVLEGRRQLFDAEDALVGSDAEVSRAAIALYKALGGGWKE